MKTLDIPVESKPYLAESYRCEVPRHVPTKWLLTTIISFFVLSTISIVAFMRYDDNNKITKAHHEAEVHKLVTALEECKALLESRQNDADNKAVLLLESLRKIDPNLESLKTTNNITTSR